jgi:hypothetical protein
MLGISAMTFKEFQQRNDDENGSDNVKRNNDVPCISLHLSLTAV